MADIPRRRIDTTANIEWIRMIERVAVPDTPASGYINIGFDGTDLVWVDDAGNVYTALSSGSAVFADNAFQIYDNASPTRTFQFDAGSITAGQNRILTVPDANLTIVGTATTQSLTNKTLSGATNTISIQDSLFSIFDNGDTSKIAQFQASGISAATTRTFTFPDADTTLVGTDTTQTLTNKSIVASQITAGTFAAGAFIFIHATATGTPLTAKTSDNSSTNPVFKVVNSSDTSVLSVLRTGQTEIAGNLGIGLTPSFAIDVSTSGGGIRLNRTGTNESFVFVKNDTASSGGQLRCLDAGGVKLTNDLGTTVLAQFQTTAIYVQTVGSTNNVVTNTLSIRNNASGAAQASFGTGLLFQGESSTTNDTELGRLRWLWTTATHASRTARGVLSAYDTAERDCFKWEASGSAPMWSFGAANPSVVQTGYTTFTNLSTDRTCDADTVLVAELADIVGTLIEDLKTKGIISA